MRDRKERKSGRQKERKNVSLSEKFLKVGANLRVIDSWI